MIYINKYFSFFILYKYIMDKNVIYTIIYFIFISVLTISYIGNENKEHFGLFSIGVPKFKSVNTDINLTNIKGLESKKLSFEETKISFDQPKIKIGDIDIDINTKVPDDFKNSKNLEVTMLDNGFLLRDIDTGKLTVTKDIDGIKTENATLNASPTQIKNEMTADLNNITNTSDFDAKIGTEAVTAKSIVDSSSVKSEADIPTLKEISKIELEIKKAELNRMLDKYPSIKKAVLGLGTVGMLAIIAYSMIKHDGDPLQTMFDIAESGLDKVVDIGLNQAEKVGDRVGGVAVKTAGKVGDKLLDKLGLGGIGDFFGSIGKTFKTIIAVGLGIVIIYLLYLLYEWYQEYKSSNQNSK